MNNPTPEYMTQGAQCAEDLASAILNAMGEVLKGHGNDPNGIALVAAGIGLAVRRIDENIHPGFEAKLIDLMKRMER